jgi:phosphoribosylglycinamide formyltransferase-1
VSDPRGTGPLRVGVLASGNGSNLQALLDRVHGRGEADVVAVASDKPGARALERAREAEVETGVFDAGDYPHRVARDIAVAGWLESRDVDLVFLLGYMALLDASFVQRFEGRLMNVHPSLLPAFPGIDAVEQALAYGVKVFGVTVHFVDEGVDTGPVVLQRAIALPEATTADEVFAELHAVEHELVCDAVRAFATGRVRRDPDHPRRILSA